MARRAGPVESFSLTPRTTDKLQPMYYTQIRIPLPHRVRLRDIRMLPPAVLRWLLSLLILPSVAFNDQRAEFAPLQSEYQQQVRPLLERFCLRFCLECHSTKKREDERDLQRFRKLSDVRRGPWSRQQLVQILDNRNMQSRDAFPPSGMTTDVCAEHHRV